MNIKKFLPLVLSFFLISLFTPKISKAVSLQEVLTSGQSIMVRVQEGVEYFFAFTPDKKVEVLEKQAEKRLDKAQNYANSGNNQMVQNMLQNYLQIKDQQDGLLEKIDDKDVIGRVGERTIEQQKTMEGIKGKIDRDGKEGVMEVQEKVVNQVAKKVIEINGKEGGAEFLNEVVHVWAPGTGPGGEAGVIYEGGGKLIYAPGTSAGGTGGVVVVGGQMMFAPGTSAGGSGGTSVQGGGGGGNTVVEGGGEGVVSTPGGQGETGATNTIDPGGVDVGGSQGATNVIDP